MYAVPFSSADGANLSGCLPDHGRAVLQVQKAAPAVCEEAGWLQPQWELVCLLCVRIASN